MSLAKSGPLDAVPAGQGALSVKPSYRWWALSCTSLGALMATLNSGTLIIALPVLLRQLHTDLITLVWVLLAYMLVQTVLVLTAGRIADMVGRKKLYVAGFAVFGLTGLVAGFCTTGQQLIAVRAVQGAAGAFMLANSSAIVTDAFPRKQLGLALGTNMIVAAVGIILGTILGGWLTNFGWQWVFWFNVPFSIIGTIWAVLNLRELSQLDHHQHFDIAGTLAYVAALMGLLIALTFGGLEGWSSPVVITGFAVAAVVLPAFVWLEMRARQPMLNLRLFTHRPFALGNLSALLNGMSRMGVTFLFVFYFQGPKADNPITAGLLLAPIAASMLVVSPVSGWFADRYGSRWLAFGGLALTTLGLLSMAFIGLDTPYWYIALTMAIVGAGSGLFNSPNTRLIMTSVTAGQRGVAAGTRNMLTNTGGVFSIAFTLAIVASTLPAKVLFSIFAGVTSGLPSAALQTFINGLHLAFGAMALLSLLSAVVAALPLGEEANESLGNAPPQAATLAAE